MGSHIPEQRSTQCYIRGRSQMTLVTFSVIVTQRGGGGGVKDMTLIDTDHFFSAGSESFTANVL